MCGRFVLSEPGLDAVREIARIPDFVQEELNFKDVYPSQNSLVLEKKNNELVGELLPFGFYSDHFKKRIINARAQNLENKWMFRHALRHNRILVPCSGFYEWNPQKVKNYFYRNDHPVLYMAAIEVDEGFVIITTEANQSVVDIHHRMPLILPVPLAKKWVLDEEVPLDLLNYEPLLLNRDQPTLF